MATEDEHYLYDLENICGSISCGLQNMSNNDDRDELLIKYLKKDMDQLNKFITAIIAEYEADATAFKASEY